MNHSTGTPTKAQAARMLAIKQGCCIACAKIGIITTMPEIHHLLSGGRRMGHDYTIGLCKYHHRGEKLDNIIFWARVEVMYGPSLARQPRLFRAMFGSDLELLAIQNVRIGLPAPVAYKRTIRRTKSAKRRPSKGNTASPSKMLPRG